MFKAAKVLPLVFLFGTFNLIACQDAMLPGVDEADLLRSQQAIINGQPVLGNDMLSTVAILDDGVVFCSGTLISPNYVLTAAHCISNCKGMSSIEGSRRRMKVLVGQDDDNPRGIYEIEAFYPHEDYFCNVETEIANDIALLKLKTPVPSSQAKPTPPMPPQFELTLAEVNGSSIWMLTAGFGKTGSAVSAPMGKKYKVDVKLLAMCSWVQGRSKACGRKDTSSNGFYYFDSTTTGTCGGDSGGPSFMTRNGVEYVAGVTSFGYGEVACKGTSGSSLVSDYYKFITDIATDVAVPGLEICNNGVDDSADGLVDCADPHCFGQIFCTPEICNNGIDDNLNGLVDCADPDCLGQRACLSEDCTNGIDDNLNGQIDCVDTKCADLPICKLEICDNGIDDNGDGLVDCAAPSCVDQLVCKPEICDNGIDDNGDGLVDCAAPSCVDQLACKPEICDNGVDDNGDGLVDCAAPSCVDLPVCLPEICDNGIDDNGDGLVDCAALACADLPVCLTESCDNGIDDNADGLVDCVDPACADSSLCVVTEEGSPSSCSAAPSRLGQGFGRGLWALLMLLALAWWRRSLGTLKHVKD